MQSPVEMEPRRLRYPAETTRIAATSMSCYTTQMNPFSFTDRELGPGVIVTSQGPGCEHLPTLARPLEGSTRQS